MNEKIHFRGFSEIRAIAALLVLFHHIELLKKRHSLPSLFDNDLLGSFIANAGKNGVYLFFVLSGFLITFLLLKEKELTGNISIKKFYLRRILRIWPLYYFIVLLSFCVLYFIHTQTGYFDSNTYAHKLLEQLNNHYWFPLILFLLFLPNLALSMGYAVPGASQAWSVGVEEQFYILWPFLIKFFQKTMIAFLIGIIVTKILMNIYLSNILFKLEINSVMGIPASAFVHFFKSFRIEYMGIGGLFAFFYFKKNIYLFKLLEHKLTLVGCILLVILLILKPSHQLPFVISCGLLITSIAIQKNKLSKINPLDKIGKVSYGIYMYHPLVIYLLFPLIGLFSIQNIYLINCYLYLSIVPISIAISILSYNFFEKPFLLKKEKLATVKSEA